MDKAKYQSAIAAIYRANGHLESALRYLTSSLEIYQKLEHVNSKAIKELFISIASVCQGLERRQDAAEYLQKAVEWSTEQNCATPEEIFELNAKIGAFAEECQDFERALKAYQSIQETVHVHGTSRATENFQRMGRCYFNLKDYENAAECFKFSLELDGEKERENDEERVYTLLFLSRALIGAGDHSGALKYLAKVEALRRTRLVLDWNSAVDGALYEAMAESYMRLGTSKLALEHFNSALESKALDGQARARIYYMMGETCSVLEKDRSSAIQFYSKSLAIQSKTDPLLVDTNMSLARLYLLQDELADSLKHLTAVAQHLVQTPTDDLSLQFDLSASIAYCHVHLGMLSSAKFHSDSTLHFLHKMEKHEYETMATVESMLRLAEAWKSVGGYQESAELYRLLSTKFSSFLDNQAILVQILQSTAELYKSMGDMNSFNKFTDLAILSSELARR